MQRRRGWRAGFVVVVDVAVAINEQGMSWLLRCSVLFLRGDTQSQNFVCTSNGLSVHGSEKEHQNESLSPNLEFGITTRSNLSSKQKFHVNKKLTMGGWRGSRRDEPTMVITNNARQQINFEGNST